MNISGWIGIANHLGLYKAKESNVHPHVPLERAHLFHTADCGSTEFEYLNLLHALTLATKPLLVLETGTHYGYGTLAIASAIHQNGVGKIITIDLDVCQRARVLVRDAGLNPVVEFVQSESMQFCRDYKGDPFDFTFHDSGGERAAEFQILKESGKFKPGAIATFHDASPTRIGPSPNSWIKGLEGIEKSIWFNLSRGFRLCQV